MIGRARRDYASISGGRAATGRGLNRWMDQEQPVVLEESKSSKHGGAEGGVVAWWPERRKSGLLTGKQSRLSFLFGGD